MPIFRSSKRLKHAGFVYDTDIKINWVNAEDGNTGKCPRNFGRCRRNFVPGGFGERGVEGKIAAIQYARETKKPFFGICLGMQLASVEFARNVLGYKDAHSTEFDKNTKHPIIDLLPEQKNVEDLGGTLRLGIYPCKLVRRNKSAQSLQ